MPEPTREIIRAGGLGFVWGLGPSDPANDRAPLPESVEAQVQQILSNLDSLLLAQGMDRGHVVSTRVNLTQFPRFEKRARRILDVEFTGAAAASLSWVGVTHLPGDALLSMDFVLRL